MFIQLFLLLWLTWSAGFRLLESESDFADSAVATSFDVLGTFWRFCDQESLPHDLNSVLPKLYWFRCVKLNSRFVAYGQLSSTVRPPGFLFSTSQLEAWRFPFWASKTANILSFVQSCPSWVCSCGLRVDVMLLSHYKWAVSAHTKASRSSLLCELRNFSSRILTRAISIDHGIFISFDVSSANSYKYYNVRQFPIQ